MRRTACFTNRPKGPRRNTMTRPAICQTSLPGREPDKRGKVRDIYDLGDNL